MWKYIYTDLKHRIASYHAVPRAQYGANHIISWHIVSMRNISYHIISHRKISCL